MGEGDRNIDGLVACISFTDAAGIDERKPRVLGQWGAATAVIRRAARQSRSRLRVSSGWSCAAGRHCWKRQKANRGLARWEPNLEPKGYGSVTFRTFIAETLYFQTRDSSISIFVYNFAEDGPETKDIQFTSYLVLT